MFRVRQEQIPEPRGASFRLDLLDDGRHFQRSDFLGFAEQALFVRIDVLVHEGAQALLKLLHFLRMLEIHALPLTRTTQLIYLLCCRACIRPNSRNYRGGPRQTTAHSTLAGGRQVPAGHARGRRCSKWHNASQPAHRSPIGHPDVIEDPQPIRQHAWRTGLPAARNFTGAESFADRRSDRTGDDTALARTGVHGANGVRALPALASGLESRSICPNQARIADSAANRRRPCGKERTKKKLACQAT